MTFSRNDLCWCGSRLKWKKCHYPKLPSVKNALSQTYLKQYGIFIKTEEQIAGIRRACKLAANILDATAKRAQAGISTNELDHFAHQLHIDAGAIPAPLGYGDPPFPKSICTSLNHEICHGIPDDRLLQEGDFLNIDLSCILDGYYGDCSKMVAIGQLDEEKTHVMEVSRQCLLRSIALLKPGLMLCEIGEAIENYAEENGCSVVYQFVGHGVGLQFHEPPKVLHHRNKMQIPLVEGMIFTIEPMINIGVAEAVIDPNNHWTAYTKDGKPSAQWEHTLLITSAGYEILTEPSK